MDYRILKPHQPESTGFSYCKKYKFYYINKTKVENLNDINILGELNLNNIKTSDTSNILLELITKKGEIQRYNIKSVESDIQEKSLLVYVGNNQYVVINNTKPIVLTKLIGIIIPLIIFCSVSTAMLGIYKTVIMNKDFENMLESDNFPYKKPIIEDAENWNGELPNNKNNSNSSIESKSDISIPGYSRLNVDSNNNYINLINPSYNDVYFKYIIDINGLNIYSSNMIEPGKSLSVNIFEKLNKGTYTANLKVETYDMVTMEKYNGANQELTIEVK